MDTKTTVVKIDHLKFNYKKHIVFEDLSLELEPGRIYGLLGENGVGKTTLLRIICGLLSAREGSCTVNGIPSGKRNPEMLKDIYYVPEIFFAPAISVNTFAKSNSLLYPRWDADQFQKLCLTFEVDPSYRFDKLSHGQQKKALIAFSLALNTRILLMDEPSNGLDIPSKTTLAQGHLRVRDRRQAHRHLDPSGTRPGEPHRPGHHTGPQRPDHQLIHRADKREALLHHEPGTGSGGLLERKQPQRLLPGHSQP